jgi:hypothetical protein
VVIRIGHIVDAVALEHPRCLVEIHQAFHVEHFGLHAHHIGVHLAALGHTAAAVVHIHPAVIVDKHRRVDHAPAAQTFDIAAIHKAFQRAVAGRHAHLKGIVPFGIAGMRIVEIIGAVTIRCVGRPHKAALRATPFHIVRAQNFTLVPPVDHILGRENVVPIHKIAALRRVHVMRRIDVQSSVRPHMRRRIGGVDALDNGVLPLFFNLHSLILISPKKVVFSIAKTAQKRNGFFNIFYIYRSAVGACPNRLR